MNEVKATNEVHDLKYRIKFFFAEFIGTALLLLCGLSLVIFMFGNGSPMEQLIPNYKLRQIITGFLFGSIGSIIAISQIGKTSGAHINPAVTMVFWLFRKIESRLAITYIGAQLSGAIVGCLPLLLWGGIGRSINFGATNPGAGYSMQDALLGEMVTTFALVSLLVIFIGFRQIRKYTPLISPFLYAIMVPLEAAISGTSTNPARSLGPAVISGMWDGWWIYLIGPLSGALLASIACNKLAKGIASAKLYHFDHDPSGMLRKIILTDHKQDSNESSNSGEH